MLTPRSLESVPRVHRPTVHEFEREYLRPRRPAIITGMMDNWPALTRWSEEYLASVMRGVEADPVSARGDYWNPKYTCIRERMDSAEMVHRIHAGGRLYLANVDITWFKPLDGDTELPSYIQRQHFEVSRLWIGPADSNTLLHYDPTDGLLGQIRGRKQLMLFPPSEYANMYVCPLGWVMRGAHYCNSMIGNTEAADPQEYPNFAHSRGYSCVLEPGERNVSTNLRQAVV